MVAKTLFNLGDRGVVKRKQLCGLASVVGSRRLNGNYVIYASLECNHKCEPVAFGTKSQH